MKKEKMIEYCKVLTSMLLLTLCVLVYNSVIASGDELIRCKEKEREALLKFKQGLIDDYGCLWSWGSEEDKRECCKWNGITCSNKTGHVIGLLLGSCGLRGKISSVLIELNYLSHLDLSSNDFGNVEIPKFIGSLEKLQHLNLEWSEFPGAIPHELGNLTNLRTLNLGGNELVFDNLDWLHHLSSLSSLDLSYSHLRHTKIPKSIGSLEKLQHLNLEWSEFSGAVPHELGNLTNLRTLYLGGSELVFDNLDWLHHLSSLSLLDLSNSDLRHTNLLQDILKLPSLKELYLNGGQFPTYFSVNSPSTSLSVLHISNSDLTFSSFHWMFNISTRIRSIDLSHNNLNASIPNDFGRLTFLQHLDLSNNQLTGGIPECLGNLSHLQTLDLSFNDLSGAVPHELGNLTNLRTLNLRGNNLVLDNLNWLHHLSSLSLLDLSYSDLRHTNLLQDILKLSSLKELYLNGGHFPTYFSVNSSSTSLSVLHISNSHLTSSSFHWMVNISTRIRSIDLSHNNLNASIPNDFGRLTFLQHLDLSNNQLTGGIPECLGNLSHLQTLDLSFNGLFEPLPELFYKLSARANHQSVLESLYLHHNALYGSLPDFTFLSSLRILWLGDNQLNGSFPRGFARVSRLDDLDVSFNSLQGTISDTHLSKLHNLKVLDLSFNSLVLNVSVDWIPPFQLDCINLASCNLGPHFPPWLHTQTNFSNLDLSCNGILEQVPEWLWDLSPKITYLNLSHNQIIGSIPDLSLKHYDILDISYNNLSGHLPLSLPSSWVLLLSDNMFVGSISSICEVSEGVNVLDLSNNQFSGEVPDCWENKTDIKILNLSNNKFSGYIPHTLGSLRQLKVLQLHNNNFSGELPSTLMDCSNLKMFDVGGNKLGGNIPAWIGTHVSYLTVLSLGHNNFNGTIPLEICYLMRIQILDLSRNFLSGRIPQCFNNFTSFIQKNIRFNTNILGILGAYSIYDGFIDHALVQWKGNEAEYRKTTVGLLKLIDLSSNKLVGNLPREFSQLQALISLNLSRNYLSGNIISDIGKMEMLESLDLSRNNFSGEIPNGLAKLDYLAVLDMSNNHLSGEIPSGPKLQTFDPSAYAGNSGLCGDPLVSCPGHDRKPSPTQQENIADGEDDAFISLLLSHEVYITIILGFIVGFWGVVGTLVLKNSWRYAYFNLFSRIGDWLYVTTTIYAGRLRRSLRTNVAGT